MNSNESKATHYIQRDDISCDIGPDLQGKNKPLLTQSTPLNISAYTTFTRESQTHALFCHLCGHFLLHSNCINCFFFYSSVPRPLPSLESPQVQFLTPAEEIAAPLRSEEVIAPLKEAEERAADRSCLSALKRPVDLPKPLEKVDIPQAATHTAVLTTKADVPEEYSEKPKPFEQESSEKFSKSDEGVGEQTELLKPAQATEKILEPARNEVETRETENLEDLQLNKPRAETVQQKHHFSEEPGEKPAEVPPVEPFRVPAEKTEVPQPAEDPLTELQDSG